MFVRSDLSVTMERRLVMNLKDLLKIKITTIKEAEHNIYMVLPIVQPHKVKSSEFNER